MFDPIKLEIFKDIFTAITDEMGIVLQKSAYSSNIKERRDFSCALFDQQGDLVIQSAHIPVHLGSMQVAVKSALANTTLEKGDIVIVNDPFMGGTHLPDITLITPFYYSDEQPIIYLANRAHHADVGGMTPGSMPLSTSIYQEGIRIPPIKFVKRGEIDTYLLKLLLANMRSSEEREGDFLAQISSLNVGKDRFTEMIERYTVDEILIYMSELKDYSERIMRKFVAEIPDGLYSFTDSLDDDGIRDKPIEIAVQIKIDGDQAIVDFTESDDQVTGSVNANLAITTSCVFYVFKSIIVSDVPSNAGLMRPIKIITRKGSIVDAMFPSGIAGGNVETSQRIADVLYGALSQALDNKIPSASQGTMNNISFGGYDPHREREFSYYETLGGGMGARPGKDGLSAIHTHMTNTLNTPIESLEHNYPVEVLQYSIRRDSGGLGEFKGGDGLIREIKFLEPTHGTILSERRKIAPYGLNGGESGKPGINSLIRNNVKEKIASKCNIEFQKNDILSIETPGGGGYGKITI